MTGAAKPLRAESSALACEVEDLLGEGGQGAVYRVRVSAEPYALKLYNAAFLRADRRLSERLRELVRNGPPSDRFLWPLDTVVDAGGRFAGYLMPLREPAFVGLGQLIAGTAPASSFYALATAAFELAHNFHRLHAYGLSYQDISPGNVFVEPAEGEIRICDNDNVSINGIPSGIKGTPLYLAPELDRGGAYPNAETDLYSLAVILFQMLTRSHPLLSGARELAYPVLTYDAVVDMTTRHPVFVYDPHDTSNHPVRGRHDLLLQYWEIYPSFLKDLFVAGFTQGLRDPAARIREQQWRDAILRMRDAIVVCAACGAENFEDPRASDPQRSCWSCATPLAKPLHLRIGVHRIALNSTSRLYPHHIAPGRRYDFDELAADVVPAKSGKGFGLRNRTAVPWQVSHGDGERTAVPPGESAPIRVGEAIDFSETVGTIER